MAALELNDKVDKGRYFHGKGCSHCNGMGYRGRTGVYELLEMTRGGGCRQRSRSVALPQGGAAQMGGETLRRHAVALVIQGRTTVSEAMRISNQVED
jgi:MSHA biogenesis protein MshE